MALSLPPDVDREGAAIVIGDDVAPSVAAGARLRGGAHSGPRHADVALPLLASADR